MIKTRFAPSPTGNLHVGGVRTALFSYLFAKANQGQFILRVEDTDQERSTQTYSEAIIHAMQWLGLESDEPPSYQSQRLARYTEVVNDLINQKKAYHCHCSKERLEQLRERQLANKEKPRYDGHCKQMNLSAIPGSVIRLKHPEQGEVQFTDLVYGPITVSNQELDDLILIRSDGLPTYNFAVVVDDADMNITHVIRGDDHINNTPRQIHLYQALGWSIPQFAHLPMILGGDGKRLSKRHGAVNVLEFREQGFLPEALLNYLVRLGWSHQDQEIFSLEEMITFFDLNHVSRSPACFDYDKLSWLNQYYLKHLPIESLLPMFEWQLKFEKVSYDKNRSLEPLITVLVDRVKNLRELVQQSRCFLEREISYSDEVTQQFFNPQLYQPFSILLEQFSNLETWDKHQIHQIIKMTSEQCGVGMGKVAQPLRVVVTGSTQSPSIDDTLVLVGKDWTLERLKNVLNLIEKLM